MKAYLEIEMPESCHKCPLLYVTSICDGSKDCPLIHVPPHGRLIDADALIRDWPTGFVKTADVINNVPTIIPVSEEDET